MGERREIRKKRLLAAGISASLLLIASYAVFPLFAKHRAVTHLVNHDPEHAWQWLQRIGALRELTVSEKILLLRAHRKRGDLSSFSRVAKGLEADGAGEIVSRQKILIAAQSGDITNLENRMLALLQDPRDEGADICEAIANGYIRNYQIEKAEPVLNTWRTEFPSDPQATVILGRVEEHRGNWEMALDLYNESLERNPGFGPAAYNAARVLLKQKRPEDALPYYDIVDEWSAHAAPAAVGRAHALRMMNKADEARQVLLPVATTDSESEGLMRAFRLLGEIGTAAVASIHSELGQIEFAAENFTEASRWLAMAVEGNRTDHTLRYLLARSLIGCGRKEDATVHFKVYQEAVQATKRLDELMDQIRSTPNNPAIRCEMGKLFLAHVSEVQGIVWLNSALQIDPNFLPAHEALADFFADKLESEPENASYQQRLARHRSAIKSD